MVSTFTPNIQLEEPARGDYVGTWDTPVNANMTLLDLIAGGRTTISGAAGSVVLAAAQFQCKTITFNSTLLASITVTFPTSFTKSYEIYHTCTGSSAFVITLQTTAAGGQAICCPPGEICEVINDGTNIRFKNFGRVGSYWDYGGSSVPAWVSGCSVPPYLNCDASTFSAATFPQLAVILGSTTLPDRRGTIGYTLNQGTGRLTTALGGLDGNTLGSVKTTQVTLSTSNLPPYTPSGTNSGGAAQFGYGSNNANWGGGSNATVTDVHTSPGSGTPVTATFTQPTFAGTAQGGVSNVLPVGSATVYGICMIRAG
jgi:hypothetical protein